MHQDATGFAMAQQPFRIRECSPEGDAARFVIELPFDGFHHTRVFKLLVVGHQQVYLQGCLFLHIGFVVQVFSFRNIEVHPHLAVVRQAAQQVTFIYQATQL
ncbi:hypothetical protein D3C87_1750880 [compost metagenome]